MKNRKAQLKIKQMTFMLIAVTLFFALVGMFVLVIKFSDIREAATELEERNAMLLVSKLANSPEFSCGGAFDTPRLNCIDADKVMILRQHIEKYNDFWGVSNIEIRKIYPAANSEILCTLENYPNCNIIRLRSKEIIGADLSNFISLCRKEPYEGDYYNKCELARIMVSYEEK
ncbi:MAG: hypothetical protein KKF68_00125 [Nanoarchaeota archaeon]|nr:hypothetical protein [Nanoarchaeota archaeon]